jgi:hypothetical protein
VPLKIAASATPGTILDSLVASFLTVRPAQPVRAEIRCYLCDPDGHLVELGQTSRTINSTD